MMNQREAESRARSIRSKYQSKISEINTELEQTIKNARDGLVSIPTPGEQWSELKNYITGDVITYEDIVYNASRHSKSKKPSEHSECWTVAEAKTPYHKWEDIADGILIEEKFRCEFNSFIWECTAQHFKSNVYKPKDGSSKWVKVVE